ncbi:NUDIX hydrolase [Paracoccus aerodenitrificans]|uniref:NUDIX hydrolase n=1 Tax=Paracoccus aerodenitrificans TaxID=3017781 RepID=UPI0022F042C8|nr:NUDIX hydrolase [Paracoccus aerodenitrificans]WBU63978.1 NUDIX hydrolase [Paracoccus aerodenitrificans]
MSKAIRNTLSLLLGRRPPVLQVGAICRHVQTREILLITSRGTGRWIIPKGWPMSGLSVAGAAAQEAWEEAGVRGTVSPRSVGRYGYDKWQEQGFSIYIQVQVHLIEVERLEDDFPESEERTRQWFPVAKAAELVDEPGLKELLLKLER